MDVGMTGRRHGITEQAMASLKQMAPSLDIKTIRHGDCVGADKQFHDFIREYNKNITIRVTSPALTNFFTEKQDTIVLTSLFSQWILL